MNKFTLINKSTKTSVLTKFSLILLTLLSLSTGNVWGYRCAKAIATADPRSGGSVYVGTSNSAGTYKTPSDDATNEYWGLGGKSFTFYLFAKNSSNYTFKGWSESKTSNSGNTNNPFQLTISGAVLETNATKTYYAIFARLTTDKSSLSFGEKNVDLGWGNSQSVKVTYVHTGKTTATISGTHATDFAFKVNNNYVQSTTVAENSTNSEATTTVTVYFNPQCDGDRTATLTFSGNGLTKTVTLTGTGVLNSQSISWNDESNIELNVLKGTTPTIKANASTNVTYSSSNNDVLYINSSTGQMQAKAVGNATIYAQAQKTCKYAASEQISLNFVVKSKDTPRFIPDGFSADETKQLKVGDKVTLDVEHVSAGLSGDFKATATQDNGLNILSFSRSGNTITIEALNAGNSTATFTQTENSAILGAVQTYNFSVSKHETTFSGSAYTLMVDGSLLADYSYTNVSAEQPTANSSDDFYYSIDDVVFTNSSKNKGTNLVTFDPSNNKRITACNAGTCQITLHQKETYKYTGAEQSFNVTVHKYNSIFAGVSDFGVKVEASQVSPYSLTYTKPNSAYVGTETITAGTPTANSSDEFYYTLTQNVTTTNTVGCPEDSKTKAIEYNAGTKTATGKNAGTGTIHFYQKETYKYNAADEDFVVTVTKNDPVFTWNGGSTTYYHNTSIANVCSSTNTDFSFAIGESTDANVAKESGNTLSILSKNGSASFTVSQPENYKWNSKSQTFTVTPENPSNHVTFTYTQAMYNDNSITTQKVSSNWDGSNQVEFNEGGFNWDDKYIVIHFSGVPDKLSFDYKSGLGATGVQFYVQESSNGSNWTEKWSTNSGSTSWTNASNISLSTSTRYIKLCYSGNLTGNFRNIKVTELKKFAASPSSLDFGTKEINENDGSVSQTLSLNYANAGHNITLTTNDDHFTVSPTSIASIGGEKTGTYTPITVTYSTAAIHKSSGAKLTISDELENSQTVNLSGETVKRTPTVTWSSDDVTFNVDDVLSATNANGLTVTLSVASGDEAYVECEGNTATMIAAKAETVTITAHVTGNDIYADRDITKDITITNKTKQYITWEQDFSRLKTTDASKSITLNATSDSDLPVSYELVGDQTGLTLTQSGDVWTLTYSATECKNTTIVAKQAGDDDYAPASSVSLPVKVVDPTKVCDDNEVLVNSRVTISDSYVTYNIDIPASMKVSFSRVKTGLSLSAIYLFGVDVEFYSGRNGTGTKLYTKSYSASDINTSISNSNINLSSYINAKSVKIITEASNGYYIDAVSYTHRKYCTISAEQLDFTTYPNTATAAQTFNVNFANYPISLECSNNKFTFTPKDFGDCSEYGTQEISVTYTAGPNEGSDVGYLNIKDNTGATLQTCTLNVTISKVAQSITTHNIGTSYLTTDKVMLTAEANSHLTDFTYSASPAGVASFNGAEMTFAKSGTIAITVTQAGNDVYNSASATVQNVVVSKVTPDIAINPTGTGLTYLQTLSNSTLSGGSADVTLRDVAHTNVPGTFAWTNPSQQITDNAGPHNYSVTFTPTDKGMYTEKVFDVSINVARADQSLEMSNGTVKVLIYGLNDNLAESKLDLSSLIVSKTDADHAGEVTYEVISANKATASINDNIFSATAGGEYRIRATQRQTDYYNAATDDFVVTVSRVTSEISNTSVKTLKVDAIQENAFSLVNTKDLIPHITVKSISEINNGDGQVIEYDAINNRIIAHNAGVAEIYLEQPETNTINAYNSPVYTYTVEKFDNSFACSWGVWNKDANFNDNVSVVLTTDNTDYAHSPIIAEASAADSLLALMTKVDATHFNMTASVNVGISTWTLTQAEDYKYLAASHEIQLIIKSLTKECLIYDNPTEYHFETDANDFSGHFEEENTHQVSGPADKIYFEAKKSLIGVNKFIVQYSVDGSTWRTIVDEPNLSFDYKSFSYTFSELPGANALQENEKVAYIRFGANTGATLSKYYKNVKISRKTWLKAVDASDVELDTLVMPENALGNSTTATFRVNYSTCDNVVKLESNNEHFALSTTNITVDGDNIGSPTEITITYSNSVVAEDTATITVYTKYENTTFTVVGKTHKKEQFIEWQEGFTDRPLILSLGTTSDNEHPAAKATSGESVVYTTDNPEVIEITLGGLGFTVIGDGTAKLCASQAGNAIWNAVSDTITIATTGKRIQQIVWEQNFRTVDWVIGQDTTLTAKVYLRDAKGNLVFSQERTDSIIYSCPKNNGVISIDSTSMTILGYGKTTVMASVPGDELYEDVMPVSLIVKVREPSEGCEAEPVLAINENIQLFSMEMNLSNGFSTPKLTSNVIELDASKGKPGFLSYQHNAEAYTIGTYKWCGGTVVAQQRINGSWSNITGSEYTTSEAYDWREVDSLQLDERADAIQFVRFDGGMGYHNFQGIQITLKHYLRSTQSVVDLGDIQIGESIERALGFEYSDIKTDLQVSKTDPEDDMLTINDNDIDSISCGAHGLHNISIVLLPSKLGQWSDSIVVTDTLSKDTAIVFVKATIVSGSQFVFENQGPWVYYDNWKDDKLPNEDNSVLINADADIREGDTINVKSMTITEGATVTVHGVLTLGNTNSLTLSKYGNLHVADGGKVVLGNGVLLVNDFILDAALGNSGYQGHSGQVTDAERLFVRGDAYFDLALDPSGECSPGWYDFTVPFPVHALTGITRFDNSTHVEKSIANEVNYAIMDFSESRHLETGYGWKKFRSVMQPGQCYTITIDDVDNVYRFKKTKDGELNTSIKETLAYTPSDKSIRGWNGLGNGTLTYVNLDAEGINKVQVYDHETNSFSAADINEFTYVVGSAYLIQTPSTGKEMTYIHTNSNNHLRAPQRSRTIDEFRLTLTADGDNNYSDRLYVSASTDAINSYEIGRDLSKFGNPLDAKVAQIWANAYGLKLCDIDVPITNDVASCGIGLFAAKANQYTLAIERAPEDVVLYLTYNNKPIWNLSMSPYVFDLTKGTTEGYGLQMYVHPVSEVATGTENVESAQGNCTKIVIDQKMYIITPEGAIYDATGKKVK